MRVRCASLVDPVAERRCPHPATTVITWSDRTVDAYCRLHAALVIERSRLGETVETVAASVPLGHPLLFTILRPWRYVCQLLWFVFLRPMPWTFDERPTRRSGEADR